jgi:hypothetical protein
VRFDCSQQAGTAWERIYKFFVKDLFNTGDEVVVSGERSGYEIRAFPIAKPSRKANRNNLVLEPNT